MSVSTLLQHLISEIEKNPSLQYADVELILNDLQDLFELQEYQYILSFSTETISKYNSMVHVLVRNAGRLKSCLCKMKLLYKHVLSLNL